ncbi:unnamed protein product [Bursaphelenchus xylophilus]|uniref:(pine wood nematode) hypothetical protein n=1 Tax=Bursaphelenchus xylophilus TaxID=6326 RepID=A0A1I7RWT8_BURXY|nr:unnamed protein product [Bursaphelenchus xylophilus]CAG9128673.1 unnamed protein product [Bursaphelenchus xylophilus]
MDIVIDGIDLHNFSALSQLKIQRFTENLTSAQYVGNILHLFVNLYFNYGILKTSLMHPNMKILVITISSQYSVIALGRIGETLNSKVFDHKPIVVTNTICIFFKVLTDTAMITSCTSILLVGVERVVTMVQRKGRIDTNGVLGFAMLGSMVLFGIFFSLSTLLYDIFIAETFDVFTTATSCQNLYTHPLILPLCWCFAGVTFIIGVWLLYYVYRHNKRMLQKHLNDPLAIRYQYATSNETLRALLPAIAGYGVMVVIGVIFSFYSVYAILSTNQNSFDVQMAFQLLYMIADFYGIYFVVYFFIRFRPMKKRLRNHLRLLCLLPQNVANTIKPIDRADPVQQTNEYFHQLSNVWNLNANEAIKGKEKKPAKKEKKVEKTTKTQKISRKITADERSNTL